MVEIHTSVFSRINNDIAAESDDVVAAGDGSEDARLDVQRSVTPSRSVRVIELHSALLVKAHLIFTMHKTNLL